MKSFTVAPCENGMRLNRFIEKHVPSLPGSMMYKALRNKRIKVDGRRADASDRISAGSVVEMYINDEFFEGERRQEDFMRAGTELQIVYEDANIMILDKPAGLLCHSDAVSWNDTLINRVLRRLKERGEYTPETSGAFAPALCNRLDRNTRGLVFAAKNAEALAEMNAAIKNRELEKRYLALTFGRPPEGRFHAYILKDAESGTSAVYDAPRPGAKEIITEFHILKSSAELCLTEALLVTGRTHQIRAHLAHLGAPIVGDGRYGRESINKRFGMQRQALCAYKVRFALQNEYPLICGLNGREFKSGLPEFADMI